MILRLQKYLSECGVCSRRHAEEAIKRGDVIVNGKVAEIGQSIDPEKDTIQFAWKLVERSAGLVYYAMNKPRGIETTSAQRGGQSIMDIVEVPTRIFPIGRLDKDSSGLILLTNDGRITHKLLHPSFEHEKEYLVTTYGKIDDRSLEQMRKGMRYTITEWPKDSAKKPLLNNKRSFSPEKKGIHKQPTKFVQTQPCEVHRASSDTFTIVLKEGKNRQIRRMVEACWHQVKKLKRIRIEHIELRDLPEGAYRELKRGEREELLRRSALPLVDFPPLLGEVIHGDGRGHAIGFPTANISFEKNILPNATFTCRVKIWNEVYLWAGTWNSSKVPSEETEKGTFEVHILDFDQDIYGQMISIDIMDIIRENERFGSLEALKTQIAKDVHHVRAHWQSVLSDAHIKPKRSI